MNVVDSTFLIDLLNCDEGAIQFAQKETQLYTTQINIFEILRGLFRMQNPQKKILDAIDLLKQLYVIPLNDEGVIFAANISSELLKKGMPSGDMDCLIAGIAKSHGVTTIVTRNVKHFKTMKGILVQEY